MAALTSVLRERRVLDGEQANTSLIDLLDELERPKANSVQVKVVSVQADVGDAHLLHLVVCELPQRQQRAIVVTELIRWVLVVTVI